MMDEFNKSLTPHLIYTLYIIIVYTGLATSLNLSKCIISLDLFQRNLLECHENY